MLFGAHLVERGIAREEDVLNALREQYVDRVPIGQLAMRLQLLTVKQVFDVLNRQLETGRRFGEQAMELGYLTAPDLARLLRLQESTRRPLGEILVANGAISRAVLERELAEFLRLSAETEPEAEPVEAAVAAR